MDEKTVARLREIAEELYQIVQRPDIYALVVVDADAGTQDNTRAMSNLTMNDLGRFLGEVSLNVVKPEGRA